MSNWAVCSCHFLRIAAADDGTEGIFKIDAAGDFTKFVGRDVKIEEIQQLSSEMLAANLIMRRAHGIYGIADQSVQQAWRERRALGE